MIRYPNVSSYGNNMTRTNLIVSIKEFIWKLGNIYKNAIHWNVMWFLIQNILLFLQYDYNFYLRHFVHHLWFLDAPLQRFPEMNWLIMIMILFTHFIIIQLMWWNWSFMLRLPGWFELLSNQKSIIQIVLTPSQLTGHTHLRN